MDKLWKDCSKEEHEAVNNWSRKRRKNLNRYKKGKITRELFEKNLKSLERELNEIEKKYDD